MKKKFLNFQIVFSFILVILLSCASSSELKAQHKCGFDRQNEIAKMNNPMYEQNRRTVEEFTRNFASSRNQTVTKIPTVVHVVHNGETVGTYPNISDVQIQSAITNLNAAFKNTAPYAGTAYYNNAMDIEFALALVSPTGTASTGIERHDVSATTYAALYSSNGISSENGQPGVPQADLFKDYLWNPQDYMNIWIVKKIDGIDTGTTGNGTLGYATIPMSNPGETDGLVCQARAFGYFPSYDPNNPAAGYDFGTTSGPSSGNGTADHEVGHYLNLYHTFSGDNEGAACPSGTVVVGTNDDGCDDIARHKRTDSVCPAYSSTGNTCPGGGSNEYIYNFMNYSSDPCFQGFSADQKTRCEAAVNGPRAALKTSLGATAPVSSYPAAVTAVVTGASPDNMGIYSVSLAGTTYSSLGSYHDGGYLNRIASQATTVLNYSTAYSLEVTVGVGNSQDYEHVAVYIDYNGNGSFADAGEAIFSSAAGAGKRNGDSFSIPFTTPSNVGFAAGPPANTRLRMRIISDFDDNTSNISSSTHSPSQGGQIEDYSVSFGAVLPVDLSSFTGKEAAGQVVLDWQTSMEFNNEGFEVQRSTDNSEFSIIGWVEGDGNSTGVNSYSYEDINIKKNITYYYRLNQIDTDGSSKFSQITSATVSSSSDDKLVVYPNPASTEATVRLPSSENGFTINLFNINGQLMKTWKSNKEENEKEMNLTDVPKGTYILNVSNQRTQQTTQLQVLGH